MNLKYLPHKLLVQNSIFIIYQKKIFSKTLIDSFRNNECLMLNGSPQSKLKLKSIIGNENNISMVMIFIIIRYNNT